MGDQCFHLIDGVRRIPFVDHGMTIWADWAKVNDWIHVILAVYLIKRSKMVNVDEAITDLTIDSLKVKITHSTIVTVLFDAARPRLGIPLVHFYIGLPN